LIAAATHLHAHFIIYHVFSTSILTGMCPAALSRLCPALSLLAGPLLLVAAPAVQQQNSSRTAAMLFIAQLDEALGLSNQLNNLSNLLTTYLPAEQVALLSEAAAKLPASLTMPSPGMLLVWSLAAILALALLEQVKYQIGRLGKGHRLPGGCNMFCAAEC
jgi:hypothetical protein